MRGFLSYDTSVIDWDNSLVTTLVVVVASTLVVSSGCIIIHSATALVVVVVVTSPFARDSCAKFGAIDHGRKGRNTPTCLLTAFEDLANTKDQLLAW